MWVWSSVWWWFDLFLIIDGTGALPLLAGVLVFDSEKCLLKAPIPQGGRWNPELGHTPSWAALFIEFTIYHVCWAVRTRWHATARVWSEDNLQELGFPFYCMGLGHQTEVTKLGSEHFCPPGHPVCPFLRLFRIGLFLLVVSFRAAANVLATLPLSDTWFQIWCCVLFFYFLGLTLHVFDIIHWCISV